MKVLAMKLTPKAQISTSPFFVYLYMYLLFIKLKKQINKEWKNKKWSQEYYEAKGLRRNEV